MTTFLEQPDQAAVDLKRRDEWRLTLDREVQMNTMQIEHMQQTVSRPAIAGGIAGELQQFIARRGWEIGYATMSGVVKRWDSFREWVEDYPDNGGLTHHGHEGAALRVPGRGQGKRGSAQGHQINDVCAGPS